jgi:hypothetical protein
MSTNKSHIQCTVFYSWQSDLPNATNRAFIEAALEMAVRSMREDESIVIEPVIDRDTVGVPGAPDIAETILRKIEECHACVFDVSIINELDSSRPTPNPNVLIELGYALKALGASRVVLVMNTAFGGPELLPFDLRMKRVVTYNAAEAAKERATERKRLASILQKGVRHIIEQVESQLRADSVVVTAETQLREAWDADWLAKHRTAATAGLTETGLPGSMEVRFALPSHQISASQESLLEAADAAQIHTFGWPIAAVLNTPEYKPRARKDGIVAEILVRDLPWTGGHRNSYDYWALRSNGDFFLLKTIFEDGAERADETRVLCFNTRIVRIAETLLYCARLYSKLGVDHSAEVQVAIRHAGLRGRVLAATSSRLALRTRTCAEDDVETVSRVSLRHIEPNIVDLVKQYARPLFILFEFHEFPDDVYAQIVTAFVHGKLS